MRVSSPPPLRHPSFIGASNPLAKGKCMHFPSLRPRKRSLLLDALSLSLSCSFWQRNEHKGALQLIVRTEGHASERAGPFSTRAFLFIFPPAAVFEPLRRGIDGRQALSLLSSLWFFLAFDVEHVEIQNDRPTRPQRHKCNNPRAITREEEKMESGTGREVKVCSAV